MKATTTIAATILTGAFLCGVAVPSAMAAPAPVDRSTTKVADAAPVSQLAAADEDEPANCSKSRKRLWVESEGWIVRRVTICR